MSVSTLWHGITPSQRWVLGVSVAALCIGVGQGLATAWEAV